MSSFGISHVVSYVSTCAVYFAMSPSRLASSMMTPLSSHRRCTASSTPSQQLRTVMTRSVGDILGFAQEHANLAAASAVPST
eukprot:CAMPEP_0171138564 /NCGR_PEP_ID=MMETSP0766_2-20121228/135299_1 /TAXON_ID=439317 /ORGANISM="Gambierdiscus australes, Strain CAWD 149" /LENGTH=81 /DNA_ID=CAMNT_0011602179 /DNA_START=46 /DNA_END=291 /DNA_ORIENTATION=+